MAELIKQAAGAGIINGKSETIFDPKGKATRAEAITMMLNVLKLDANLKNIFASLK